MSELWPELSVQGEEDNKALTDLPSEKFRFLNGNGLEQSLEVFF